MSEGGVKRISPPPGLKEEMIANDIEERNWKGILIALLVIVSICSLILLSILLLSPHFGLKLKSERLKLEDFVLYGYEKKGYNGSWISDRELLYNDNNGSLYLYNIDTKWRSLLAESSTLRHYDIRKFSVSADRRFVLLAHDIRATGTYSYTAKYKVFDTQTKLVVPLKASDDNMDLQHAGWGPNSNQLIVIHRNNLIFYPRAGDLRPFQLTITGREGFIYNGIPDLMYEEHILKTHLAYWWMNDGSRLCFASFDNSRVDQIPYILYGATNTSSQSQVIGVMTSEDEYPKVHSYPYPKPGREISKVTLWIADLNPPSIIRTTQQIIPPKEIQGRDHYITAPLVWISKSSVAVVWSQRSQNFTVVSVCKEEKDWLCEKLIEEQLSSPSGWLVVNDGPIFSDDKNHFFLRLPVADGMAGTFDHIAMISSDGGKKYFLTHGQYVVTKLFAYRSDLRTLYFAATVHNEPGMRHIFSVTDMNSPNPRKITCLSCNISEDCLYNNALFSPNGRYYILECLGPGIPSSYLLTVDENQIIEILETNSILKKWTEERSLPKIKFLTIPTNNGFNVRVQLILPPGLQENEDIKYPSVLEINGQPGGQSVDYLNKLDWFRYLTSKKDYITIHIDTRGSGFQGDKYMFEVYHQLGEVETQDIIMTLKYLKDKLSYIDEDKIVVWGKEYGGFLTVSLLASDPLVTCAIAVSPITNWRNYVSVFSERYMGMPWPQDNFINYEKTDLTRKTSLLKGKTFLLVHGTIDKRVNIHHSMLLIKSLTEQGVQFKVQLYPDSGIIESWDILVRLHFYKTMEDFFAKCFQVEEEEEYDEILPITRVIKGVGAKKFD